MNWVALGVSTAGLGVAVWGFLLVRRARRELQQLDRLYKQAEEDHGVMVHAYLDWKKQVEQPRSTP